MRLAGRATRACLAGRTTRACLATLAPRQPEVYAQHAKHLAEGGYLTPPSR
ncbi:hypothetical protein [Actinoplanes sp. NPDC049599]|uniref:hypothetical protein n=1 Tax=Actinoplanes sp. NPDC049599 TaxID=3363903 RepID=UPI0037BDEF69